MLHVQQFHSIWHSWAICEVGAWLRASLCCSDELSIVNNQPGSTKSSSSIRAMRIETISLHTQCFLQHCGKPQWKLRKLSSKLQMSVVQLASCNIAELQIQSQSWHNPQLKIDMQCSISKAPTIRITGARTSVRVGYGHSSDCLHLQDPPTNGNREKPCPPLWVKLPLLAHPCYPCTENH